MRILCLDVGDKKIGVSLSDPTHSIAQALKVYRRNSLKEDLKEFKDLISEHDVERIVVGLPKDLSGMIGKKAKEVLEFAEVLEKYAGVPIVLWDERFTTNEAHRVFEMAGISHKKRRPYLDMMASQLILQGYLDANRTR